MVKVLFSGKSNLPLASSIAGLSKIELINSMISKFSDGEISVEVEKTNSDGTFILMQSLFPNSNERIMELLLLSDAVKRSSCCKSLLVVIPYFAYARQDRVVSRSLDSDVKIFSSLSAKVIANVMQTISMDKLITIDLHFRQAEGFFNIPVINIDCSSLFVDFVINNKCKTNIAVVAPDVGSLSRARIFAGQLIDKGCTEVELVVIDKLRVRPGISSVMNVLGNVKGKNCIIVDDIIDSGGTIYNVASILKVKGAIKVDACVSHAILSGSAIENLVDSALDALVVTDTIDHGERFDNISKIHVVSVAKLICEYL